MHIYKTTNSITGKIYVGCKYTINDKYLGSGVILKRSIRKHGIENFTKEILEHCDSKEHMYEREQYWIKLLDSRNPDIGYNISKGGEFGDTMSTHPRKKEIYESIVNKKRIKKSNGLTSYDISARNRKSKMLIKNDQGLTKYQVTARKSAKTMLTTIDDNGLTTFNKILSKLIQKKQTLTKINHPWQFEYNIHHVIIDVTTGLEEYNETYLLYDYSQTNVNRKRAILNQLLSSKNNEKSYYKRRKFITLKLIKIE